MQARQSRTRTVRAQSAIPATRRSRGSPRGIFRPGSAIPQNNEKTAVLASWEIQGVMGERPPQSASTTKARPSNERRKRMERMKRTKQRPHIKPLTKLDRAQLERTQEVLAMRNVMRNAESLHRRDEQLHERAVKQQYEADFEKQMHEMMETDRVAAVADLKRQDIVNQEKARERARILEAQLEDRQNQRLRAADELESQKEEFKRMCHKRELEELEKKKHKLILAKQRREELDDANKTAIEMKFKRQERAVADDLAIVAYQQQKAWEEEKAYEEKQRVRKAKDKEAQRMMLAQKRFIDGRAAEDEGRMIAAYKEKERIYHDKIKKRDAAKAKALADLKAARRVQIQQKAELIARQAEQERWEAETQEEMAREAQAKVDAQVEHRKYMSQQHRTSLGEQMQQKRERRHRTRKMQLDSEFGVIEEKQLAAKNKVEDIRKESIAAMRKMGIPEVYWKGLNNQKLGQRREITPSDEILF